MKAVGLKAVGLKAVFLKAVRPEGLQLVIFRVPRALYPDLFGSWTEVCFFVFGSNLSLDFHHFSLFA